MRHKRVSSGIYETTELIGAEYLDGIDAFVQDPSAKLLQRFTAFCPKLTIAMSYRLDVLLIYVDLGRIVKTVFQILIRREFDGLN